MPTNVGPWFHRLAAFLEDDERQSVLGDIAERGADVRALLDLLGLVILRQLQAWLSWQPWVMAASLALPAIFTAFFTHPVASIVYSHRLFSYEPGYWAMGGWVAFSDSSTFLIQPWKLLGAVSIAWAIGFTLGRLGGHRSPTVLPLLLGLSWWQAYKSARVPISPMPLDGVSLTVAAMALLITIPLIHGFHRGLQRHPLSIKGGVALCALMFFGGGYELYFMIPGGAYRLSLLGLFCLWPVAYVAYLAFAKRKHPEVIRAV